MKVLDKIEIKKATNSRTDHYFKHLIIQNLIYKNNIFFKIGNLIHVELDSIFQFDF